MGDVNIDQPVGDTLFSELEALHSTFLEDLAVAEERSVSDSIREKIKNFSREAEGFITLVREAVRDRNHEMVNQANAQIKQWILLLENLIEENSARGF